MKRINPHKLLIAASILLTIFFLSGGLSDYKIYRDGTTSIKEYRFATIAPFFAGFVFVGFLGMLKAYKNAGSVESLYGFAIVGFCYFGIELLFWAVENL